jgi:hypothetical protein
VQGRVFVGQRAEAFAVNLGPVFDLINFVPIEGSIAQNREENDDVVGEFNVTSLAIEMPIACLTEGSENVIGAWTTTSLPQGSLENPSAAYEDTERFGGAFVQQSRLGMPLVNELVIGLPDKDLFNASEPMDDGSNFALYVTNPTFPRLVELALGLEGFAPTNENRADLQAAFLTGFDGLNRPASATVGSEMLRLNTAFPAAPTPRDDQSTFGVAGEDLSGFPNGRRPGDDVVDIVLRVALGALCHPLPIASELGIEGAVQGTETDNFLLGVCEPADAPNGTTPFTDGAPISAAELQNAFPYLNTPLPGATTPVTD